MAILTSIQDDESQALSGRVVLITGGTSGIGRAAVLLAYSMGANVIIVDITVKPETIFEPQLDSDRTLFCCADVSNWDDILEAFQAGYHKFGRIDIVCANAGTNSWDELFKEEFSGTGKLLAPNMKLLHVNLFGVIYCAKAALHYFSKHPDRNCQLVLTGSASSFFDTPPLYLYTASKAGVLGLMRSLRTQLRKQNVTVNMVAPWMTVTPMLPQTIVDMWQGLPANTPEGVAKALLLPGLRPELNGKSLFVAGNQIYELEDELHHTQPIWMGEDLSSMFEEGQRRLFGGSETAFGVVQSPQNKAT